MKASKQDIQDLLSQLAADIEDIKAMLNGKGDAAGATAGAATDVGASSKVDAISNDVAVGNGGTTSNADRVVAEVTRLLEPIAQTCGKLSGKLKSYYAQLLLRIPKDLREELARDNDARKRKGQLTVEDKIDNTLTMAVAVYDRLNQIEYALRHNTPKLGQSGQIAAYRKSVRSGIISVLKSVWSGVRRFCTKRPNHWYRKPHILFAVVIYLLYFALSIYSCRQWRYYRAENTRLRLTADKYRVDSIILREVYPKATITLYAYEHITEAEGAEKALQTFWENNK